jgi:rod shape-determining protein MreB
VVGIPAKASDEARQNLEKVAGSAFDKFILIPEPFLAALGFRDENRLSDPNYIDPVKNSLFIDIGAGTTDFCIIQGYFPTPDDQLSIPYAGDEVDQILTEEIKKAYPEVKISLGMIRKFKEEFSYIGETEYGKRIQVPIGGKPKRFEIGKQIGIACNSLLNEIFNATQEVIAMASAESVFDMLQNIIITGGGSRIKNIAPELQRLLLEDGYANPRVSIAGDSYKEFVAIGAYKAAKGAKENQWLTL